MGSVIRNSYFEQNLYWPSVDKYSPLNFFLSLTWQLKTQSHIIYYTLLFSQVLSSHFTGVWLTEYFYCRVVKRHVTILQMKITWADATPTHRGGFASAAGADTWAGHSWDRKTALMLRSSCAWACPVDLMQVNTCAWCCGAWFAITGFPHGYLRAFCIICLRAL